MNCEKLLHLLASQIAGRKKRHKPLKVGIDGRGAAGKSTFADALGSALVQLGFDCCAHPSMGYLNTEDPESKADVIVDNNDFVKPRIVRKH